MHCPNWKTVLGGVVAALNWSALVQAFFFLPHEWRTAIASSPKLPLFEDQRVDL
tara:strand:- start:341 stop:502 length:162 start_codon:yes stop_codon:yes gene_type:complete